MEITELKQLIEDEMAIRSRVDELYATIKKSKDEIEAIRNKCPHTSSRVGDYQPFDFYIISAKLCTVCDKYLGTEGNRNGTTLDSTP